MRVYVDFNLDGTKLSGELMFTGPVARLEGNRVMDSLKKFQKENGLKGGVTENHLGYINNIHTIYDEDVIEFSGTDGDSIIETVLSLNKKRFPDKKVYAKHFPGKKIDVVVVSEDEIPDQIDKDYNQRIWEKNEEKIKIDANLFEWIKELNEKGYDTMYCCSGHKTVHDGFVEVVDNKGYSAGKFKELFPDREHGDKTIVFRSCVPLISTGYIIFEYNDKNLDLFRRLENECPSCKNAEKEFGVDNFENINYPFHENKDYFSDEIIFYTEYPETVKGKKRLVLRWCPRSSFKVLPAIQETIEKFL